MALLTKCLLFVTAAAMTNYCHSQNAVTPLWPCYSVFKIQLKDPTSPLSSVYRYTSKFVARNEDEAQYPDQPDCVFTLEGPPNSRVELQLFNVVIQRPGYVSKSHDSGNCSMGAIRIYNFTVTGDLVQVNEICNSFQTGMKLLSDTNVAVITTTIATGHFDLQATVIPQNNSGRNELIQSLPTRKGNIIHLGHTQNELSIISKILNSPELESRSENPSSSSSNGLINVTISEDAEYYDDYSNMEDNEGLNNHSTQESNLQNNQFTQPNDHKINHDLGNRINKEKNHNLNQVHNRLNHQTGNRFTQQNSQLNEPMNHSNRNQHDVQLHPTGNIITQNQQENGQLNHPINHANGNLFTHQQNKHLNHAVNHFKENPFIQHQNGHTNQLTDQFHNSMSSQFTHQLKQSQNQLIDHILSLLTDYQNLVHHPNNIIQTKTDQLTQKTDHNNQMVNPSIQLEMQRNDASHKPDNHQQNGQIKKLMNLLPLTAIGQVQLQENDPPSQLANQLIHLVSSQLSQQQNAQISLPTIQSIQPASTQLIKQANNQNMQFVDTASSQSPQRQSVQGNEPTVYLSHPTSTSFTQQGVQTVQLQNQLPNILRHLLSHIQHDKTNQYETQIHTENNQIIPQKNHQTIQAIYQSEHNTINQLTKPQNIEITRPISHLIRTAKKQVIPQKKDQSKIPSNVVIHSAGNHISDINEERANKIKSNLMHLKQNQITDQKTDQTNQYVNKLIHPTINEMGNSRNSNSQHGINQLSDSDQLYQFKNETTSLAPNIKTDQSNESKGNFPENQITLPVINESGNILKNQSTYRNDSKFVNPDENLLPQTIGNINVAHRL